MTDLEKKKRIDEIEKEIKKLQSERMKLKNTVKYVFEDERNYLYDLDPTTYEICSRTGERVMNRKFKPFWKGIMNASYYEASIKSYHWRIEDLTDEEIKIMKPLIRKNIETLVKTNNLTEEKLW